MFGKYGLIFGIYLETGPRVKTHLCRSMQYLIETGFQLIEKYTYSPSCSELEMESTNTLTVY